MSGAKSRRGAGRRSVEADADLGTALRRARKGDEDGFKDLWTALQPRLLRYLRVKAGDMADDVASETWLQVVRDLSRFRGEADEFRAWLFTVARHRAVDAARSRKSRAVHVLTESRDLDDRGSVDSAETQALENVSTRQALALVASLPPDQAETVALRVIAGLDVSTVASILGKTPGAVRVNVHRGLRTLARALDSTRLRDLRLGVG